MTSYRTGLAALVLANTANRPTHVGIDNKAICDKANTLLAKARQYDEVGKPYPKKPLKRPWRLQTDGDPWELLWQQIQQRGPNSMIISKVKGHATDRMVEEGLVKIDDKIGNDHADKAATSGINDHFEGMMEFNAFLQQRRKDCTKFMAGIQSMIIGITKEHRQIQEQKTSIEQLLVPENRKGKMEVSTELRYAAPNDARKLQIRGPPRGQHSMHEN